MVNINKTNETSKDNEKNSALHPQVHAKCKRVLGKQKLVKALRLIRYGLVVNYFTVVVLRLSANYKQDRMYLLITLLSRSTLELDLLKTGIGLEYLFWQL